MAGVSLAGSAVPARGSGGSLGNLNTLFYVDFTPDVPDSEVAKLCELKETMREFCAWVTGRTEAIVARKRGEGAFQREGGGEDTNALSSYRAKAMEAVLRQRTVCLASTANFTNRQTLTIKSPNLHEEILLLALKGFPVPKSATDALEGIIQAILKNIGQTKGDAGTTQYSILATVYVYDRVTRTIDPKLRMIRFETDAKTREVAVRKQMMTETTMTMEFSGAEWDFMPKIWEKIYEKILPSILEEGRALADPNAIFDVPI